MTVAELEPQILWNNFLDLNAVPRPSKREEKVRAFVKSFAEQLNLPWREDEIGNIVIEKPATKGMENRQTVILQSHVDMVHQKNRDKEFDFDTQGIESFVDGDWVKAKGTTLGADNGIGVAAAMSVLASKDIEHPPIEALFTIDEEAGMTGASNLQPGFLKGDILFNMDSEDEGELTIGCAGGIDTNVTYSYQIEDCPSNVKAFEIELKGLFGGHSGVDIHLQRGNANKLLNRVLYELSSSVDGRIASFTGGNLRNAIPREAFATLVVPTEKVVEFEQIISDLDVIFRSEFRKTDPNLSLKASSTRTPAHVLTTLDQKRILGAIYACPNGVYRYSPDIEGLVETSNNLAFAQAQDGKFEVKCLTRSSVNASKKDLMQMINAVFTQMGAEVEHSGEYPGWEPNVDSKMLEIAKEQHKAVYGYDPKIMIIHAGLENGIILKSHPNLDSISFGPTIKFPHSPDEQVEIATVQRFWEYLKALLKHVPTKN